MYREPDHECVRVWETGVCNGRQLHWLSLSVIAGPALGLHPPFVLHMELTHIKGVFTEKDHCYFQT